MTEYLRRRIEDLGVGETLYFKNAELTKTSETGSWMGKGTQWAPIEGPEFHMLVNGSDEDEDSCDCIMQYGDLWRIPSGLRIRFFEDLEG